MEKYFIYEENIDRLRKKMARIEKKCSKYNLHFHFEEVGEEFREVTNDKGQKVTVRYIEVEVEGIMKHENWEFIAQIDHYNEGNIIRQFNTEVEVPIRFRHTAPVCEHCNAGRRRKFTYLIRNTETGEFKQVGSSCLQEFTNGLDANAVAHYISMFDELITGEACTGSGFHPYYELSTILCYAKETIDKLGYVSTSDAEFGHPSTCEQVFDFYFGRKYLEDKMFEKAREKMEEIDFNPDKPEIKEYVDQAIAWIRSISDEETKGNSYLFSLKIACSSDYFEPRNAGFIVSLIPTYRRHLLHLEYIERQKKAVAENPSRHQGTVGQRITFKPKSIECVCSNDTMYGTSFLYKILDEAGNVYMWSTGKAFETADKEFKSVTGTVKSHDEYRGIQQTFLTRCKVA